jgi:hypothetical protein
MRAYAAGASPPSAALVAIALAKPLAPLDPVDAPGTGESMPIRSKAAEGVAELGKERVLASHQLSPLTSTMSHAGGAKSTIQAYLKQKTRRWSTESAILRCTAARPVRENLSDALVSLQPYKAISALPIRSAIESPKSKVAGTRLDLRAKINPAYTRMPPNANRSTICQLPL